MEYLTNLRKIIILLAFVNIYLGDTTVAEKACKDFRKRDIKHGQAYLPYADPCIKCQCDDGNQKHCLSVMCGKPTCEHFVRHPEKCCEYTCPHPKPQRSDLSLKELLATYAYKRSIGSDRREDNIIEEDVVDIDEDVNEEATPCLDDEGNVILPGDRFVSSHDPCITCECRKGRGILCIAIMCARPTCENYQPVPGKCCEYTCDSSPEMPEALNTSGVVEHDNTTMNPPRSCRDHKGDLVPHGLELVSTPAPCMKCQCSDGAPQLCHSVACSKPPCPNYRKNPNKCCGYDCIQTNITHHSECQQYLTTFTSQAQYWLSALRNPQDVWSSDILPAAIAAMQVIDMNWVTATDTNRLNVLQLHNVILSALTWSKEARSIPTQTLSDFVFALKAACHNPADFHKHNLLVYLERSVERGLKQQTVYSLGGQMLTLCASGRPTKKKFMKKLKQLLKKGKSMLDLGDTSMATLAYTCMQEQGEKVRRDLRTVIDLTEKNFLPTSTHAALAVQALQVGKRAIDCRGIKAVATHLANKIRSHNYSLPLAVHIAEMVPVLYDKTLLDITHICAEGQGHGQGQKQVQGQRQRFSYRRAYP